MREGGRGTRKCPHSKNGSGMTGVEEWVATSKARGQTLLVRLRSAQRDERAQAVVAEVKASPEEHGNVDRGKDVAEEWVADAQVGSDSAAEIAGQQDCAEYGGTRNRIEDNTDEQDDPDTENQAYGISEASGTLHGGSELQYFDGAVEEQEQYDQSAYD